jgi:hypothetical protein
MFDQATRRRGGMLVVFLMVVSALAIMAAGTAFAAPSGQAKPTTHPVEGRENCSMCHPAGSGGVKPAPADHEGRPNGTCVACHKPAAAVQPAAGPTPTLAPGAQPSGQQPGAAQPGAAAQPQVADPMGASEACRACHKRPEFETVSVAPVPNANIEAQAAAKTYAHRTMACVTCHEGDPHQNPTPATRESTAEACGKCHVFQRHEHEESIHGESLAQGGTDAASCVDCHSTQATPHSIARVLSPESPAYHGSVAATCAKCHAKTEVMGQYDVPTDVYKTYMTTFHGKANILSPYEITQHPKASCIDCHGSHNIKSESDPASPVAQANLPNTCGQCHPGAGEQFAAGWLGHQEATPEQFPVVYFAERFFFFLTSTVLTFGFIFMVALELGSWLLRRTPTQH